MARKGESKKRELKPYLEDLTPKEGVNSGMMARLYKTDGSMIPSHDGNSPGDVWNPLRPKRT